MFNYVVVAIIFATVSAFVQRRNTFVLNPVERKYSHFSRENLDNAREMAREMFYFGWDNYLLHAFPHDELDPIHCTGRSADHHNPDNININDVLGDYSLTLIDSLDSLAVFGDVDEFERAVRLVINTVNFEKNTTVQVFESTIRVIGGLLSAHLIATDDSQTVGDFYLKEYNGELLKLAQDLCDRLLPAFEDTATGIPFTRVNLKDGVLPGTTTTTCTAGAGSLLLEFGILSRLLGNETYEKLARNVNKKLWELRDPITGLMGNLIDIQTGQWVGYLSGLGAGLDSYYELLLKAYVVFSEEKDLAMFNESFAKILTFMRRGRDSCLNSTGDPPIYVNVDSRDGSTVNTWIDALQASFAGVLVLAGFVDEAVCQHAVYYAIWKKYGVLPERFNWKMKNPDVSFYPLRPEFAESTYLLYSATKNPFYQRVGLEILESIDQLTRVDCGFATVHDVRDGSLEDRMESFFLAETMKYLYLLFDPEHPVNRNQEKIVFSTEGHIFPISKRFRSVQKTGEDDDDDFSVFDWPDHETRNKTCESGAGFNVGAPPMPLDQMRQVFDAVGVAPISWL